MAAAAASAASAAASRSICRVRSPPSTTFCRSAVDCCILRTASNLAGLSARTALPRSPAAFVPCLSNRSSLLVRSSGRSHSSRLNCTKTAASCLESKREGLGYRGLDPFIATAAATVRRAGRGLSAMAGDGAKSVSASLPAPEGYRANVGICLLNAENKVFVASRIDKPGAWQMPQGGIDGGEDPTAAARRELREETGVTSADLLAEVPDWLCYDFPPDVRAKLTVAWGKEWQGQAQKWFLFRFTGTDEKEITLDGDGSERPEFEEWKWLDVQQVIDSAVDFKRPVYEAAFQVFSPYLQQQQSTT